MDAYQRFPNKWKTLGVRWPNRHGVTAPLGTQTIDHASGLLLGLREIQLRILTILMSQYVSFSDIQI